MPAVIPTITVGSGLGAVALLVGTKSSKILAVEAFVILWAVQFIAWGFWFMFIYPFFISPLRKLPTPPGWRWGMGHSVRAVGDGLGVTAREW